VLTIALIAINVLGFFVEVGQGDQMSAFVFRWGAIPWELTRARSLDHAAVETLEGLGLPVRDALAPWGVDLPAPVPPWLTAVTSMFLHGSWAHLLFNMLYLWIFGNNIEDRLGRARFLPFYLGTGLAALGAHVVANPASTVPVVGASGAIGGVLGAYLALFPHARVTSLLFLGFFIRTIEVPALLLLGVWFVMQLFSGVATLGVREGAGVAYWAHIGGFAAGWLGIRLLVRSRDNPPGVHSAWDDRSGGWRG
jgi:membrane associated rhomboid family serine protease